ncbi:OsmC family protein [Denitromonas halophila]|uniref:OsmC family protein n=1 Tax=Denitromonas halophila TaxID=1629404 RepID=A0A557R0L9_9RHOO|nr:OsmC family protein [Denitromonas halophila]TVO58707.1 OsmC family protein [Denitromonas halophila]
MSTYTATVVWQRGDQVFTDNRYSRRHEIHFDGGLTLAGSSSPHVVPVPYSDTDAVDPEEAFVAALSSCHMLWFLSLAGRAGFCVDHYEDAAEGVMAAGPEGRLMMTLVTLKPAVRFHGRAPTEDEHAALHHAAHDACFIANSVKSELHCLPRLLTD